MSKKTTKPAGNGGTPATQVLAKAGVEFTLWPYDHDPANTHFGDETVAALGLDPRRVFKTLLANTVGAAAGLVCAVVPVSSQLDLKALATAAGAKKADMANPAEAERVTGYLVGGISPIGQKRHLATFVDASALDWPTIFVSAGRRGLQVELSAEALIDATNATIVAIAR